MKRTTVTREAYWPLIAALVLPVAASACGNAGKDEARALISAVDRYRSADGDERTELGKQIANVSCSQTDLKEARTACSESARLFREAADEKRRVSDGLARIKTGALAKESEEAQSLGAHLDAAQRYLDDSAKEMEACERQLRDIRRKYGTR
jgi:hypothetical protein